MRDGTRFTQPCRGCAHGAEPAASSSWGEEHAGRVKRTKGQKAAEESNLGPFSICPCPRHRSVKTARGKIILSKSKVIELTAEQELRCVLPHPAWLMPGSLCQNKPSINAWWALASTRDISGKWMVGLLGGEEACWGLSPYSVARLLCHSSFSFPIHPGAVAPSAFLTHLPKPALPTPVPQSRSGRMHV